MGGWGRVAGLETDFILASRTMAPDPLAVDQEFKKIEQGVERARNRYEFRLFHKVAVTAMSFGEHCFITQLRFVHFAGVWPPGRVKTVRAEI